MLGFFARLVGGALDPLIDKASTFGARLLRKVALFFVAGACLMVVLIALTIAFDLWVASKFGAIAGALAVAAVYLAVAIIAIVLALRNPKTAAAPAAAAAAAADDRAADAGPDRAAQIDQFTAPLLAMLARFGLRREQLAVLAGSSLAKQLGPLPLVGLAILAGFLIGRMGKSWRALLPIDALSDVLSNGLFGFGAAPPEDDEVDPA